MADGVFFNPKVGDIIASGNLSAAQTHVPSEHDSWFGDKTLPEIIGQYSSSAALVYDKEQSLTDEQKTQLGVNGGYRYKLINAQLQHGTITVPNATGQLVQKECDYTIVEDFAVTTITLSTMNDVVIFLPSALDNRCRDLVLKVKVETETAPQVQFLASSGEPIDFESDDDSWGNLEPGINFMLFTETERI